ncbi:WD repeat-containing protein 97 [Electrophorus electricus]|uniref:WD repeat-containing protein 97 n=1 Tax=Electrophorus electricus TaxID=8005 RepID=UPI0015CFABA1|nr:WD repeat-containing protein 97 [Electrophorus electricus]
MDSETALGNFLGVTEHALPAAAVADNADTLHLARTRAPPPPDTREGERSAHRTWRVGYPSKGARAEQMPHSDSCPDVLTNGLQHITHVPWEDSVSHVTCGKGVGGFLSLHQSGRTRRYHPDGRLQDSCLQPALAVPYEGLTSTQLPGRVVGWGPGAVLTLLDMELEPVAHAREPLDVRVCQAVAGSLDLITAGAGNVCVWCVRHMVCPVRVVEGLGSCSVFTLLAVATPLLAPRVLAACRMSITLVDLAEGRVLEHKRNLHPRDITGLVYCPLLESVVTASTDMTIRVWGPDWELRTIFMGHTAVVTSLLLCPVSGLLVSSSLDGTVRCWSLEEGDQVQVSLPIGCAPPLGLGGPSTDGTFFSYSRTGVNFWTFSSLCQLHCKLGGDSSGPVRQILAPPSHRPYPARVLCVHGDSDVTLVSAETGAVLTAFRANSRVRCADYCLLKEILLVLTEEGTVIRANTLTNPVTVLDEWHRVQKGDWSSRKKQGMVEPARCMALYSNIADPQEALEEWMSLQKTSRRNTQDNGRNSVIQMQSGIVQYRTSAHNGQNISSVQAYPDNSCLLTTGEDDSVLVWRVFPYAQECVSLQASVFCAHTPVCEALLDSVLAICMQQPHSATYCLVQYNLHTHTRMDHPPEHGHSSTITGKHTQTRVHGPPTRARPQQHDHR